ncbi:hypothetical protein NliqN6_6296 [Naganishia liquefaciens]|uniref:acylphosphatase n=1 Tax=Naganishia liquefaciens TaxID=104408 RepID=A0A8H3TZD4_9TREE|nr:hypothetical protein NliqN6_6296 [Naganishia liquefaciens]
MSRTALIHFKVIGKVQGVSFRYYTQKEASSLGLTGWCHNHPDESVEGVAFGQEPKVDKFRQYLSEGPSAASVQKVEYVKETYDPDEQTRTELLKGITEGFHVRRFGQSESIVKNGPKH